MCKAFSFTVCAGFGVSLLGCASSPGRTFESTRAVEASESAQADQLWEAVQETLRRHHLRLDRVDRAAGVITTMPETSQHWFEVWRRDVATTADAWEATLNPIRRWIEVSLRGGEAGAWTELRVVVHKERLSSPDRQFNSSGAAYQFFGESLPSTTGHYRVTAADDRWLDLGRDPAMEDHVLRAILRRCPSADRGVGLPPS